MPTLIGWYLLKSVAPGPPAFTTILFYPTQKVHHKPIIGHNSCQLSAPWPIRHGCRFSLHQNAPSPLHNSPRHCSLLVRHLRLTQIGQLPPGLQHLVLKMRGCRKNPWENMGKYGKIMNCGFLICLLDQGIWSGKRWSLNFSSGYV